MCGANKTTLSNKTVANSFYNDQLLYYLISSPSLLLVTAWYIERNDVVIADIGGQALDILHCTESAQKKITVKAHTHTLSHLFSHSNRIK